MEDLKIVPNMELNIIKSYTVKEYKNKIAVYGNSFATQILICEIDNPFFSMEEKRKIVKKIVKGLKEK
jgi:hypothetical protein